jgi:hypothetical protein
MSRVVVLRHGSMRLYGVRATCAGAGDGDEGRRGLLCTGLGRFLHFGDLGEMKRR